MVWYNYNLPLVRMGVVEDFETKTKRTNDKDVVLDTPYKNFSIALKDVKIIKRPDNFTITGDLLNYVGGVGEPNIENGDTIGILSAVPPLGTSFEDRIVRKLKFNKLAPSSYEVLATYHL